MANTIRPIDYCYVTVDDSPGEALRILTGLKEAGVNLLACCGFPVEAGKAQIDLVPEDPERFRQTAENLGLQVSNLKRAFLIQGEDRVGAAAEILNTLSGQGINVVGSQAVSAGSGRWGMILWVKPDDYGRASQALGV